MALHSCSALLLRDAARSRRPRAAYGALTRPQACFRGPDPRLHQRGRPHHELCAGPKGELFEKQMDRLYQSEHYTLAEHMKTFNEAQDQGQGWRGMMPGVKSSPEFATIKRGIAVFEAMTPEEVNSTGELLGRREKLRLAESAGCTVEDVNELLKQYELLQQIHRWIKVRKSKGLAPPRSSEELQAQMASDRDGLSAKFAAQSMPGTPSKYRRAGKKRRY